MLSRSVRPVAAASCHSASTCAAPDHPGPHQLHQSMVHVTIEGCSTAAM